MIVGRLNFADWPTTVALDCRKGNAFSRQKDSKSRIPLGPRKPSGADTHGSQD